MRVSCEDCLPASTEQRLKDRGIKLPAPPNPFDIYVEAVRTGMIGGPARI
jgi:hypothetical protein